MDDFTYDVVQKKRVAAGARHKKNGSKSKFVGLPSDHMTPAQLKKLNGPCETYNLNKPMRWYEFKEMPLDLQQKYLDGLVSRFSVSLNAISKELFGLGATSLANYITRKGLRNPGGKRLSEQERLVWEYWMNPPVDEPAPVAEPVEEPLVALKEEEPVEAAQEEPAPCEPVILPESIHGGFTMIPREEGLRVADLAATFTGKFEPDKFLKWVAMLPMPEGKVKIRVEVTSDV